MTWIAGGKPTSVYATSGLSYYGPWEEGGRCCRECAISDRCPDFYDLTKPEKDPIEEALRKLRLQIPLDDPLAPDVCLFNAAKDTFDNGIAVVTYDNDVRATYTVNVLSARSTRQMSAIGTDAMVEADMEKGTALLTERHTNKETFFDLSEAVAGSHGGADTKILADFFRICREGGRPRSGLQEGRLAVQLSLAATTSDDEGRVVNLG